MLTASNITDIGIRVRPRFFDQVGHETMYASSGNKHFFTKSSHRQTHQNYEQSRQKFLGLWSGGKNLCKNNFSFAKHNLDNIGRTTIIIEKQAWIDQFNAIDYVSQY